jgi:amphi-Trp domain-containing protein
MAETTDHEEDVSRDEAADLLQDLAREIRGQGTEPVDVQVGNKTLTLTPSSTVEERSPMLGGEREEITVTLEWEVDDEPTE